MRKVVDGMIWTGRFLKEFWWAIFLAVVALFVLSTEGKAQTQPVTRQPDCQLFFSFTAAAQTQQFNNRSWGCSYWIVTYNSQGWATQSLQFEDAPDAGGVPGAWVAFAGAITLGINPNTAITQATSEFQGYYPWLRMRLVATTGGPGTTVGTAYGWRTGPPGAVSGTVATNIAQYGGVAVGVGNGFYVRPGTGALFPAAGAVATGADGVGNASLASLNTATGPVVGAAYVFNGATWDRQRGSTAGTLNAALGSGATGGVISSESVCDTNAVVTLPAAPGSTQIVALTAARSIRVCHVSVGLAGADTLKLVYGTGANCAVGPTDLTGAYPNILTMALDFPGGPLVVPVANALCVNSTAGVGGGGVVSYAVY